MSREKGINKTGLFIRQQRMNIGITQNELADVFGFRTPQFVSNWERGRSSPPMHTLAKLCDVLKVSKEALISKMLDDSTERFKFKINKAFEVNNADGQ